jgi:hypothetical protein
VSGGRLRPRPTCLSSLSRLLVGVELLNHIGTSSTLFLLFYAFVRVASRGLPWVQNPMTTLELNSWTTDARTAYSAGRHHCRGEQGKHAEHASGVFGGYIKYMFLMVAGEFQPRCPLSLQRSCSMKSRGQTVLRNQGDQLCVVWPCKISYSKSGSLFERSLGHVPFC